MSESHDSATPIPQPGFMPAARDLIRLAIPTVATMTSFTLMQFVDRLMVSRIGPDPVYVGAQGNGGLASWMPISFMMGLITVINSFVSQNLGASKPERGAAYAWHAIYIAVLGWLALIPYALAIPSLFSLLGHEGERLAMESSYARILVLGSCITLSARAISHYFYGMHKPTIVMVATILGNLTNIALNWVLIYGHLGAPALGVTGAAIATVIGTAVEFLVPFAVFLSPKFNSMFHTRRACRVDGSVFGDILRVGWPGGLMFVNEMFCWSIFMIVLVGEFGEVHSTAGWIAHQYMSMSFMPAVGMNVAITASVGKCMGMGRPDLAATRTWVAIAIAMVYMVACGLVFVFFRHELAGFLVSKESAPEVKAEVVSLAGKFLIAAATFQLFDAIAMTVSGALRGAGDTHWPGIVTVILAWTLIVGGGVATVTFVPDWKSVGPWAAASAYIIILSLVLLARFLGGKWRALSLVRETAGSNPSAP